jgi:hypothetical protein
MLRLSNDSVSVNVKSFVFDEEVFGRSYGRPVYWLTAVGPRVALQSVFASLINKKFVELKVGSDERERCGLGWEYNLTVPEKGRMHVIYKKLQSGLSGMVMYSSLAKVDSGDRLWGAVVLLCREDEDKKAALFHFLNSKVKIPLSKDWKDWVWSVVSRHDHNMRPLVGCGLVGFYLMLDACEETIGKAVGPAIRKGLIKA